MTVVTEKFKSSKHSNTSMLQFLKLTLLKYIRVKIWLSDLEVSKVSIVVYSSNKEEDLCPSKWWNFVDGSNTIGYFRTWKSWSNVEVKTVGFLYNVSYTSELSNTSVLKLGSTVLVEGLLGNSVGKSTRIPESSWLNYSKLVFESS